MSARFESVAVEGGEMQCYVAGDDAAHPGVLVCMHAPGVDEFIQDICERLGDAGFVAAAPDVYHRHDVAGLGPLERMDLLKDDEVIDDLRRASAYLAKRSDPARQYVVGFCMGGRLAYLWAAEANVDAAAVFYPGNTMVAWGDGATPFARTEEINCPLLGFFGHDDENPSPADADAIEAKLRELDKIFVFHRYEGAGHAFLNTMRPSFRPDAAADAWAKCIDFLQAQAQ